ncbi:MAG TPA: hypothetical protein VGU71_10635 [Candidatus Dormibacteraeota bacterium]|nr:hypothetical protein [Candidatus Dormibacteraeota bacterium]
MTREDFRRELGNAFDAISGSPSPALSDRVRSSLAEAPEQRGPVWIAGLAAAVIAVLLVGVLVVANNRHQPILPVGPATSPNASPSASPAPSPSASPSVSPVASPVVSGPPFVCASSSITGQAPPLSAYIDGVRVGTHTGYDRLTIEFSNGQPSNIDVTPQSGTTFTQDGSGQPVTLAGRAGILVTIHTADAHTNYSGLTDFKTGYSTMVEVRQVGDYEGYVHFGIGLSKSACYRAFILTNPTRLVIDIQVS